MKTWFKYGVEFDLFSFHTYPKTGIYYIAVVGVNDRGLFRLNYSTGEYLYLTLFWVRITLWENNDKYEKGE